MSETDVERLMIKLDEVGNRITRLETQVGEMVGIKDRTIINESDLRAIRTNCEKVQAAKQIGRIPWQNLPVTILGGIAMIIIGALLALVLTK